MCLFISEKAEYNSLQLELYNEKTEAAAKILPFQKVYWSDDDIQRLRDAILETSLKILLDGRASRAAVAESLEWIVSEEISPFSFEVCASESGYSPSALREQILDLINTARRTMN